MSPFDISRIQSTVGARGIARDAHDIGAAPGHKPDPVAAPSLKAAETGLKLETGLALGGAQAPVDSDRVAQIRAALSSGTYPLLPTRIADAMIAAPLLLASDA